MIAFNSILLNALPYNVFLQTRSSNSLDERVKMVPSIYIPEVEVERKQSQESPLRETQHDTLSLYRFACSIESKDSLC